MKVNKNRGFTLVELVIVVVILGVLAVTAVPRFIDLSADTQVAKLEDVKGKLNSVANLVYGKAVINAVEKSASAVISTDGDITMEISYGYPLARWDVSMSDALDLGESLSVVNLQVKCATDWCIVGGRVSSWFDNSDRYLSDDDGSYVPYVGSALKIWPKGYTGYQRCGVFYINQENGLEYDIGVTKLDC